MDEDEVRFRLSKPIQVPGTKENPKVDLKEVVFRKPSGGDILAVGNPVIFDPASEPPLLTHDVVKMSRMIARLSGVLEMSQAQMEPQDWVGCAWAITPFFIPPVGRI